MEPTIVVHGGTRAWDIPERRAQRSRDGTREAARVGYRILVDEGTALDAVEAAVRFLEDDPAFDAGTGSVLNSKGEVEMDAMIMDGKNLNCGSVACLQNIQHPVTVAKLVMQRTAHTMLVGKGANEFAAEMGVPEVDPSTLIISDAEVGLESFGRNYTRVVHGLFDNSKDVKLNEGDDHPGHDTVGAVAFDRFGNVACATSTGGIAAKRPGRVGDSPITGCGGYADNQVGAVSCTGHGESITKVCLAHRIITSMENGDSPAAAIDRSLKYMAERVNGFGGAIAVDNTGNIGHRCSTSRMAWSSINRGILQYGLDPSENISENWNL